MRLEVPPLDANLKITVAIKCSSFKRFPIQIAIPIFQKILNKNTSELISFAIDEIFTKNSDIIRCAEIDDAVPNEQTQAAMRDVRAKINLESITLDQLQRDCDVL